MYLPDQGFSVEVSPTVRSVLPDPWGWEVQRQWYRERGVTFAGILTNDGFVNVQGGIKRGAVFEGKFEGIVGIDFERLAGLKGLTFFSNIFQTHGNGGPGRSLVNGLDTISNIEALPSIRLSELWLEQKFWEGRVGLRVGQLTTDSEFYNSQYFNVFLTSDWPTITSTGLPGGGPAYPLSTPGIRLKLDPTPNHSMLLALFNGDPAGPCQNQNPEVCNRYGLNFRVKDPPLLIGELQYRYNQDPKATGLAGGIRLGAYHHFGTFNDLRFDTLGLSLVDPASSGIARRFRGNQGVYAVFDQQFYRPRGGDASSGITGFTRIGAATSDRNLNDFYLEGGLISSGMVPGRPLDMVGAVFLYSHISNRARALDRDLQLFLPSYPLRNYELSFELSYAASVVPGWTVQPNIQYVMHPGGNVPDPNRPFTTAPVKDALVFSLRSTLRY